MANNPNIGKIGAKVGKKFTSEYQPSPKAKSAGLKKRFSWEKAKREMWAELAAEITFDGVKVNAPEEQIKRWQKLLLSKPKINKKGERIAGYTDEMKDDLMFKIIDKILPKETKLMGDKENPIEINLSDKDKAILARSLLGDIKKKEDGDE